MFGCGKITTTILFISSISLLSKDWVANGAWYAGVGISKWCQKIPFWDSHIEPLILKSSGIIFVAYHNLLKGMISDNNSSLTTELHQFESAVANEVSDE